MEDDITNERDHIINEVNDDEEEISGCSSRACWDPSSVVHRLWALLFMCLLGFGSYFCYDNPGALQDNFISDMDLTTSEFVKLYSLYSWPNVVLCFVGGFLIDRVFGIRLGTVIYAALVVVGQIIVGLGGLLDKFWLMGVGRFIFGIGGESLAVAQNNYAVLWFKGKELNMVFGLQLSFARVGSTVNFLVMEPLYNWVSQYYQGYMCIGVVLLIASSTCIMSLGCGLILAYMDKRAERILKRKTNQDGEVVRLTDVKDFPAIFWLISVVCVAYYVAVFPFIALGKVFFERKFEFSPSNANTVNSIVYIISAVASPLLGLLVDKVGKNVFWVIVSVLVSIGCHGILAFSFLNPYVAMSILGIAYSMLASALWPMVALVIPEYQLGTAYGFCQSVQNLGLAVSTLIAGQIVDSWGYLLLEMFFLACLCVALVTSVIIWILDANSTGILNMTPRQREVYERNRITGISVLAVCCNRNCCLRQDIFPDDAFPGEYPYDALKSTDGKRAAEALEREKLLASGSMSDITPHDLLQPHSDFHIRNRYLSRIGAPLPSNYSVSTKALVYRALR